MWAWPISLATSSLLVSFIHDNVLVLYESITVRLERYRDIDQQMEAPVGYGFGIGSGARSSLYEHDEHDEQREVGAAAAAAAGQPTPPISSVRLRGPPSWTTSSQRLRLSPPPPMLSTQPRRRKLSPVDRLRLSPSGRRRVPDK